MNTPSRLSGIGAALVLGLSLLPVRAAEQAPAEPPQPAPAAAPSPVPQQAPQQSPSRIWDSLIKPAFFKDKPIAEDKTVIELTTPYRAEDAALVPISINAKLPQTPEKYIKTIHIFVDENPVPHAASFHLTPELGRADLAMRVRVDKYTNIRAIAELNSGELHMVSNFVKAQGGCSAPPAGDRQTALAKRGEMRFKTLPNEADKTLALGQLMISHPNLTGMQLDQQTRAFIPPHFLKTLEVSLDGKPIMTAETDITISEDPAFRFFFRGVKGGKLTAKAVDSKGEEYTKTFELSEPVSGS